MPNHDSTDPRLVEAVVATIGVGLIGLMALQLAGRTAMLITLGIGALYIPLVLVGESLLTESLLVPLILAATNCALREPDGHAPLPMDPGRGRLLRSRGAHPRQRDRGRGRPGPARLDRHAAAVLARDPRTHHTGAGHRADDHAVDDP